MEHLAGRSKMSYRRAPGTPVDQDHHYLLVVHGVELGPAPPTNSAFEPTAEQQRTAARLKLAQDLVNAALRS